MPAEPSILHGIRACILSVASTIRKECYECAAAAKDKNAALWMQRQLRPLLMERVKGRLHRRQICFNAPTSNKWGLRISRRAPDIIRMRDEGYNPCETAKMIRRLFGDEIKGTVIKAWLAKNDLIRE